MPLAIALEALKAWYLDQCKWLRARAAEFETGTIKVTHSSDGQVTDVTAQTAREYRHRAGNLEVIIQAYERLDAKNP